MKFSEFPFNVPDIEQIKEKANKLINEFNNAKNEKEALKVFYKYSDFEKVIANDFTNISVHFTIDTTNEEYKQANNVLEEISPVVSGLSNEFHKALLKSPYRPYLEKKLGSYLFKMYENSEKTFDEAIIPLLIEENKLVSKYDSLIASAKIKFDGKVLNLPQMSKYMQNPDREVRKAASKAYYKFTCSIEDELADIYDKLVHLRHEMALKLGFKNFVELGYRRLGRLDYNSEDVASYREQIRKAVTPIAKKLNKARLVRIGVNKPYCYDMSLSYPEGNPTPIGDKDVLVDAANKMYSEMSEDTKYFFNFLVDNELMDLEAKPGKQSGGYMTYFPLYKCPFIFSNFNGTSGDVDVLTHEFGHAFQAYESKDIKISEYQSPTLEACEIHSMSMEFFAYPWMNLFFKDPARYKESHLSSAISFLPYGVSVDEFQHFVYENPNASKQERNKKWLEIEKKYTPYKSNKGSKFLLNGSRWMLQGHIYSTPFYYIDYTFAQVFAFEFHNLNKIDHDKAWDKYIKLCKLGGQYPFVELVRRAKLSNPFGRGFVKKNIKPLLNELGI